MYTRLTITLYLPDNGLSRACRVRTVPRKSENFSKIQGKSEKARDFCLLIRNSVKFQEFLKFIFNFSERKEV